MDRQVLDVTKFRCIACGYVDTVPYFCECCGTPVCNKCGRAGCITNVTEMIRLVSDRVSQTATELKKRSNGTEKPKARKKEPKLEDLAAKMLAMKEKRKKR